MGQPHVVIFPYDEQGHINPAFALGRALAGRGIRVTGLLLARRYADASVSWAPSNDSSLFHVEVIPDHGEAVQDIDDVEAAIRQFSLQRLDRGLEELMHRLQPPPSCLVSDLLYHWSQDLADRLGLPRFQMCVFPAVSYLLCLHFPTIIAKGLLPFKPGMEDEVIDFIPGLWKDFRLADVPIDFLGRDSKHLTVVSRIQSSMRRAAGVVINTVYELEPNTLDELSADGLSVYAAGPLLNVDWKDKHHPIASLFVEDDSCLCWLDVQRRGTVVYVAFGSLVSLSNEEIQELAMGLETCGQPFLWVLRGPPAGVGSDHGINDLMSMLPEGFLERTKDRGRVVTWAPQVAVLSHSSIGCFISHCGMSSVLEALWAGVPMIGGFYKISDQNTVFRLMTKEWGVAMALSDRGETTGCETPPLRCAVETCVKEMMHGERGLAFSQKALQLKATLRKAVEPDGSSYLSLTKLASGVLNS